MDRRIENDLRKKWINGRRSKHNLIHWLLPNIQYKYSEITNEGRTQNDYKILRSGIIPVVTLDGNNYWMLGSFHDYPSNQPDPILTDFGGTCKNEEPLSCAVRETKEESRGLLNGPIINAVEKGNYVIFEGSDDVNKNKIFYYIVFVDYEEVKDI